MYDPKLKEAMEEIKAIIKKYDCAASVLIQSKAHAEYLYELSPSWSCVTLTPDGQCRVKAQAKTGPPEEAERLRASTGMLMGFMDHGIKMQKNMETVIQMLIDNGISFNHFTIEE